MSDSKSWTGTSWRLTGAISRLHEHSMLSIPTPPIIVMIPCGQGFTDFPPSNQRHSEYGDMMLPISQAHGHFVANVLHPYVRNKFRVKDGPDHIYAIGSSLGGQASLQLLLRYPEIFGGAACLSPCFQAGTIAAIVANLVQENSDGMRSLKSKKIYLDNGGDTDDKRVPMFDVMDHFTLNDNWYNPGFWWLDTQLQPTIDAVRWTLERGNVDHMYKKFPGKYKIIP
jgi:enterochelin esterase-like enzyme